MSAGNYYYLAYGISEHGGYNLTSTKSDPYDDERVRSRDRLLHQTLTDIFHDRCLTSGKIKRLLRINRTNKKSIIKEILRREPSFAELFQRKNKLSILWIAVLCGYQESAELLVRSGADVNEPYGLETSPCIKSEINKRSSLLHVLLAMYPSAWNERFCALLIDHGARLKARDAMPANRSVLHSAVWHGRVKTAEMLLERGANVNAARFGGMTPLLDATMTPEVGELLPLLMRHGADIQARSSCGFNVLRYLVCASGDNVDLAKVLIEKGVSPNQTIPNHFQSIHMAVWNNDIKWVNLLLDHGADVNALGGVRGYFPLYIAAGQTKNPEMLMALLNRGANVDQRNARGQTALHTLTGTDEKTYSMIQTLVYFEANMFVGDRDGLTPIHIVLNSSEKIRLMVLRTLAQIKSFMDPSIEYRAEKFIEELYPEHWNSYLDCLEQLDRMRTAKFVKSGALFELITKCDCQIVALMRNHEFRSKLRTYDISAFSIYTEELLLAFDHAERYYKSVVEQEKLIDETFYNIFPHMIVRKMAHYVHGCESCELQDIE